MDEFTSRIEELNSKISVRRVSASQQNLPLQAEACNGSGPISLFATGLGNGSLTTGPLLPHSSSSSQLARESPVMEEVFILMNLISVAKRRKGYMTVVLHSIYEVSVFEFFSCLVLKCIS
jgi:hypothetical protein